MTSHHHTGSAHPIEAFVRATSSDLAASAEQPLWSVDADGARTLVRDLARLVAQVAVLEARAGSLGGNSYTSMKSTLPTSSTR